MTIKEKVFSKVPRLLQNPAIALFNTYQYKIRHGGAYKKFRDYYSRADFLSEFELTREIKSKRNSFFKYVKAHSSWYQDYDFECLSSIPILEKLDIINHFDKIKTLNEKDGLVNFTGGTTGTSMKTVYTKEDMQERFAILDNFRAKHGYELGKKTAWFSGKSLISEKDIKNNICSHYDFINKIRFYSTFHINNRNFITYWNSLNDFKPEFIVGFPSSVYEICEMADRKGLKLNHKVSVFFPTAETVLPRHREIIGRVLGCKLVDQYASSEGAPFILECTEGKLHIHPLTGMFEVVDENMQPADEGEVLVTSFTTKGTPLIRYKVGDKIKLSEKNEICKCGSSFPLVDKIEGRSNDFIYSFEKGKINLGNLSNSTKGVGGIVSFQVVQDIKSEIIIKIVASNHYNQAEERKFLSAIRERVGNDLNIDIQYVDDIPREKSGKFRIVKNSLNLDDM